MRIEIKSLHNAYGKQKVLHDISLSLDKQGITAILGPNGSGKTTLIKSILGMVIPYQGDILLNNQSILNKWQYKKHIDYLPQIARFPENLKFSELINMLSDIRRAPTREHELIHLFDMENSLHKKMGHMSGGTRQKANIILSMMFDNPIVILDEPSNGLDPIALLTFKSFIRKEREKGKLIIVCTHILNLVDDIADDIIFILEGKVYFYGPMMDLKQQFNSNDLEVVIAKILQTHKDG